MNTKRDATPEEVETALVEHATRWSRMNHPGYAGTVEEEIAKFRDKLKEAFSDGVSMLERVTVANGSEDANRGRG